MGTKLAPILGAWGGDVVGKGLGMKLGPWVRTSLSPTLGALGGNVVGKGVGTKLGP